MIRYVIDASALVKLVVPEDDSDKMQTLAALHRTGTIQLLTPDFALIERERGSGFAILHTGLVETF